MWCIPFSSSLVAIGFFGVTLISWTLLPLHHAVDSVLVTEPPQNRVKFSNNSTVIAMYISILPVAAAMVPCFSTVTLGATVLNTATSSSSVLAASATVSAGNSTTGPGGVDLRWHAPANTAINNLDTVINSNGVWDFIYNSSTTPQDKYGIYNWCNMPHVRKSEYKLPSPRGLAGNSGLSASMHNGEDGELELHYVEVIQRHHKRTPYSSNAFPVEPYHWDCDDQALFRYGEGLEAANQQPGGLHKDDHNADGKKETHDQAVGSVQKKAARIYWKGYTSFINPFVPKGWIGNCSFPQITLGGLDDSWEHGHDLYGVYGELLGLLPRQHENKDAWLRSTRLRVTQNQITSQVAGMAAAGLLGDRTTAGRALPALIQAETIDSLEPKYSCPYAAALFSAIQSPVSSERWRHHLEAAAPLYAQLDRISGVPPSDDGFHKSFDHYYDNLSARQCHAGKPLPCKIGGAPDDCVTQAMANAVYRLGHWEYSHIYRDDPRSLDASVASMGVWFAELADHLRIAVSESNSATNGNRIKYFHNFAHDGSMARAMSFLQIDEMVWPGMGSELVFEVWRNKKACHKHGSKDCKYFLRVLFGGRTFKSSNPSLGVMDLLPLDTFLAYVDGLAGRNAARIMEMCARSV